MDDNQSKDDFDHWFSTYSLVTAERVLGYYQIILPQAELIVAIKSPVSFYRRLLVVPLRHVLNGIIFQQANDYHVYAQKLLIDYLLSGEGNKPPEAQGAHTRELLEEERQALVTIGEAFNHKQLEHDTLIAQSQMSFMTLAREWREQLESAINIAQAVLTNVDAKSVKKAFMQAFIYCELKEGDTKSETVFIEKTAQALEKTIDSATKDELKGYLVGLFQATINFSNEISSFIEKVNGLNAEACSFRTQFYEKVLKITELLTMLSEYKVNPEQDAINREPLYFDKNIGETGNK
jgi:hypothetical protein